MELYSLQTCYADLPASPAGLFSRFAPSGFALCARILLASLARVSHFALTKIFERKSVSRIPTSDFPLIYSLVGFTQFPVSTYAPSK